MIAFYYQTFFGVADGFVRNHEAGAEGTEYKGSVSVVYYACTEGTAVLVMSADADGSSNGKPCFCGYFFSDMSHNLTGLFYDGGTFGQINAQNVMEFFGPAFIVNIHHTFPTGGRVIGIISVCTEFFQEIILHGGKHGCFLKVFRLMEFQPCQFSIGESGSHRVTGLFVNFASGNSV